MLLSSRYLDYIKDENTGLLMTRTFSVKICLVSFNLTCFYRKCLLGTKSL